MADIKGLLADPEFNKLDGGTQRHVLGRVDPAFNSLSDSEYQSFRQKMSSGSKSPKAPPTSFLQKAGEFVTGLTDTGIKDAEQLVGWVSPKFKHAAGLDDPAKTEKLFPTPKTGAGKLGQATAHAAEYVVPIADEVKAAEGAGALARYGMSAARNAIKLGAVDVAQTGSGKEGAVLGAGLGVAGEAFAQLRGPLASWLKKSARHSYAEILRPSGGKVKESVQKTLLNNSPTDLVGRKFIGTSVDNLKNKAAELAQEYGQKLNDAYAKLPESAKINLQPIYDDIYRFVAKNSQFSDQAGGGTKNIQYIQHGLSMLERITKTLGPELGSAHPVRLREFRQVLDKELYKPNVMGKTVKTVSGVGDEIVEATANSIRDILNKQPDIGKLDSEFHFWQTARESFGARGRALFGQMNFAKGSFAVGRALIGEEAGRKKGGTTGALIGAASGLALSAAFESVLWKSVSSVVKDQIANLLAKGATEKAASLATRAISNLSSNPTEKTKMAELGKNAMMEYQTKKTAEETALVEKSLLKKQEVYTKKMKVKKEAVKAKQPAQPAQPPPSTTPAQTIINHLKKTGGISPSAAPKPSTTPPTTYPPVIPPIPDPNSLTYVSNGAHLGGMHPKHIFADPQGNQYLFKPSTSPNSVEAYADEVASKIQSKIRPFSHIPAKVVQLNLPGQGPVTGSVQAMVKGAKYTGVEYNQSNLNKLAKEQVLDWLISNHDASHKQFITSGNKLFGVDKSQAFKFFGKDSLSSNYSPNPGTPVYNYLWNLVKGGHIQFNPGEVYKTIKAAMDIPDAEYKSILQPYADAAFPNNPTGKSEFLQKAVDRKNNLLNDFNKFYSDIMGKPVDIESSYKNSTVAHVPSPKSSAGTTYPPVTSYIEHNGVPITPEEHAVKDHYKGSGYAYMNAYLYKDSVKSGMSPAEIKLMDDKVAKMDSVISKHSLKQDLVLNRGLSKGKSPKFVAMLKASQPGDIIAPKSFQSTSLSPHTSISFAGGLHGDGVLMKINATKGTNAYAWNSEKELVLGRNTKYKVTKVDSTPGRLVTVYVDLVQ